MRQPSTSLFLSTFGKRKLSAPSELDWPVDLEACVTTRARLTHSVCEKDSKWKCERLREQTQQSSSSSTCVKWSEGCRILNFLSRQQNGMLKCVIWNQFIDWQSCCFPILAFSACLWLFTVIKDRNLHRQKRTVHCVSGLLSPVFNKQCRVFEAKGSTRLSFATRAHTHLRKKNFFFHALIT